MNVQLAAAANPATSAATAARIAYDNLADGRASPAVEALPQLHPDHVWPLLAHRDVSARLRVIDNLDGTSHTDNPDVAASPRLRACARAAAHHHPDRWITALADRLGAGAAHTVATEAADGAAWPPPAPLAELVGHLTQNQLGAAVVDTGNDRIVGDTVADRVRQLAADVAGDPDRRHRTQAARHALAGVARYALHADERDDDENAAAVAAPDDVVSHTGDHGPVDGQPCPCRDDTRRRARWMVAALTRTAAVDETVLAATWLRATAARGDADLTPLLDAPQPLARAAAVVAHGDADDRANLALNSGVPLRQLVDVVDLDGSDATRLAERGAAAAQVAAAYARDDLPDAAPGMLTALLDGDDAQWQHRWGQPSHTSEHLAHSQLLDVAVAAADPSEIADLADRYGDVTAVTGGYYHLLLAALLRDDADAADRARLVDVAAADTAGPARRNVRTPPVEAMLQRGCLRGDELARVCAAHPDVAARVATFAGGTGEFADASPRLSDALRRAAPWLPLPLTVSPRSPLAAAVADLAADRLGDDDAWQTLFALADGWQQPITDLVDAAAAVRTR